MARLNKLKRQIHQGLWLTYWKMAGRPSLGPVIENNVLLDNQALNVRVVGKTQQPLGVATKVRVTLGDVVMTSLVAQLGGKRLCKDGCINVRSGTGEWQDIQMIARLARRIHIEAAIALNDHEAMRAAQYIPPVVQAEYLALQAEMEAEQPHIPVRRL
jgi:hypothetical protein